MLPAIDHRDKPEEKGRSLGSPEESGPGLSAAMALRVRIA
jgi:hypothetical protein